MKKSLSSATVQDLHLALIEKATFNEFDGKKVVKILEDNRDLWYSTMMTRPFNHDKESHHTKFYMPFIPLRDMNDNINNVDTLVIHTSKKYKTKLLKLMEGWNYDKIRTYLVDDSADMQGGGVNKDDILLAIWWD